jgi:hypothetical protein
LPEAVTKAVALHHQPIAEETEGLTPLAIVHAANHFAHELKESSDAVAEKSSGLDMDYLEANGLAEKVAVWREAVEQATPHAAV